MSRTEKWKEMYDNIWAFTTEHRRGPTRHHKEEARMLNWLKYNRKRMNKNLISPERKKLIEELRAFIGSFCRVNQYC